MSFGKSIKISGEEEPRITLGGIKTLKSVLVDKAFFTCDWPKNCWAMREISRVNAFVYQHPKRSHPNWLGIVAWSREQARVE